MPKMHYAVLKKTKHIYIYKIKLLQIKRIFVIPYIWTQ